MRVWYKVTFLFTEYGPTLYLTTETSLLWKFVLFTELQYRWTM
jgi:hypothetical protein